MLHSASERMYLTLELKFQLHSNFLLLDELRRDERCVLHGVLLTVS